MSLGGFGSYGGLGERTGFGGGMTVVVPNKPAPKQPALDPSDEDRAEEQGKPS